VELGDELGICEGPPHRALRHVGLRRGLFLGCTARERAHQREIYAWSPSDPATRTRSPARFHTAPAVASVTRAQRALWVPETRRLCAHPGAGCDGEGGRVEATVLAVRWPLSGRFRLLGGAH
jgi:hypothetical protein